MTTLSLSFYSSGEPSLDFVLRSLVDSELYAHNGKLSTDRVVTSKRYPLKIFSFCFIFVPFLLSLFFPYSLFLVFQFSIEPLSPKHLSLAFLHIFLHDISKNCLEPEFANIRVFFGDNFFFPNYAGGQTKLNGAPVSVPNKSDCQRPSIYARLPAP